MTCFPGLGFVTSSLRLHWEVRDSRLCCLSLMNILNVLSDSEVCLAPASSRGKLLEASGCANVQGNHSFRHTSELTPVHIWMLSGQACIPAGELELCHGESNRGTEGARPAARGW